jgi:PAS domain S-box-containing protein
VTTRAETVLGYVWAALAVGSATLLTFTFHSYLAPTIFPLFFAAVMLAAWSGGIGPGIAATLASTLILDYWFFEPTGALEATSENLVRLGTFALVAIFIAAATEARRRAMVRQARERERLQVTLSSIADAVIATDADGRITFVNHVASELVGWSEKEARGKAIGDVLVLRDEHSGESVRIPANAALDENRVAGLSRSTVLVSRGGEKRSIEDSAAPITSDGGKVRGSVIVFRDVSRRRRLERQLSVQYRVSSILATAPGASSAASGLLEAIGEAFGWQSGGMWIGDRETGEAAPAAVWTAGMGEASGSPHGAALEALSRTAVEKGTAEWRTSDPHGSDGSAAAGSLYAFPTYSGSSVNGVIGFTTLRSEEPDAELLRVMEGIGRQIGTFIDRIRAEAAIRESELRHRVVTETASDAIVTIDAHGTVIFANPAVCTTFGWEPEELVGRSIDAIIPERYREAHNRGLQRYIETGRRTIAWRGIRFPGLHRDGHEIALELSYGEVVIGERRYLTGVARDVTEREAIERERRQLAHHLELLLSSTGEGIFGIDVEGRCTFVNRSAAEMLGYAVDELLGRESHRLVHHTRPNGEPFPVSECPMARAAAKGEVVHADEDILWRKDGSSFYCRYSAHPIVEEGNVTGAVITFSDATEAREAREALRVREVRQSTVAELGLAALGGLTIEGLFIRAAEIVSSMLDVEFVKIAELTPDGESFLITAGIGWQPGVVGRERIPRKASQAGFALDSRQPVVVDDLATDARFVRSELLARHGAASGISVLIEGQQRPHGVLEAHSSGRRSFSSDDVHFLQAVANTIGEAIERRRSEELVREQRNWFEVTLSSIADGVVTTDREGRITYANSAAESLSGIPLSQARGRRVDDVLRLVDERTRRTLGNPVSAVLATLKPATLPREAMLLAADGREVPIDDAAAPILDASGEMVGAVMVFHDVTERRGAERERSTLLQQIGTERERLANIVGNVPGVVWEAWGRPDGSQSVTFVSRQIEQMLGYPVEQWLSTPSFWLSIIHPDDLQRAQAESQRIFTSGKGGVFDYRWLRKDGAAVWVETHASVIFSENGKAVGLRGVTMDVSDRRRAEEERRELLEKERAARKRAETAQQRAAFLAEVSTMLAASADLEATLRNTTQLAVPRVADWCAVDVLDEEGNLQRVGLAHSNPERIRFAQELARRYPADPNAAEGIGRVLRTGEPQMLREITDETLRLFARDEEHFELLRQIGFTSAIIAPLISSGRSIGAITFVMSESRRYFDDDDLVLAEEIARRAAVAIEKARLLEEAQQANQAKDEFLATLSHELRTPMTAILGWARLLEIGGLDDETERAAVETIERSATAQAQIIEDILEVSRIIRGKLTLEMTPVDLSDLVSGAVEAIRPTAAAKGVEFSLVPAGEPIAVMGDPSRLQQVMWNLLSNAVKFTPRGGRVEVRVGRDDSLARIDVDDSGQGIPPRFLPFVFDRFRQAESSTTRTHGGLGLGLSIVRHLVEMHGGNVTARSEGEGKGACFSVTLPIMAVQPEELTQSRFESRFEPGTASRDFPDLTGTRVLVVDDEADARNLIATVLRRCGAEVETAGTVREALDSARDGTPDIIVSDIAMPEEDGFSLIRRVRHAGENLRDVPVIALTAFGRAEDESRILQAGFDRYLKKPVEPADLARAVAETLAS